MKKQVDVLFHSALHSDSSDHFVSSGELVDILSKKAKNIGFVGYPNVGKSSTINSILKKKCTSVSMTPGKTKHYQVLYNRS